MPFAWLSVSEQSKRAHVCFNPCFFFQLAREEAMKLVRLPEVKK